MGTSTADGVTVYNLEVEQSHTYYVLAADAADEGEPAWVHNASRYRRSGYPEVDPSINTDNIRSRAGVAHGGNKLGSALPGQQWIANGFGMVPREVADQLRGHAFNNWRGFRQAFWSAVGDVPHLLTQFSTQNQRRILAGRPPIAPKAGQLGRRKAFELDHMVPLNIGGERGLYDLGNLMVASPRANLAFTTF